MKMDCEVIRDLLPLYADDVCSDGSKKIVEEHLPECPGCSALLEKLRKQEIEDGLHREKNEVIQYQAKRFKRRSAAVGSVIAGIFMVPVLVCLVVNLATGAGLTWFFIVLAGLAVAASLIIVPLMVPKDKLFWTFCAFSASLLLLLAVIALVTGSGSWFFPAASAVLFGLSVVGLPFVLRAAPVRDLVGDFSRPLLIVSVDLILFTNMMNMITLHSKGWVATLLMELLCVAGIALLGSAMKEKRSESK